jgi:hypothetical protein
VLESLSRAGLAAALGLLLVGCGHTCKGDKDCRMTLNAEPAHARTMAFLLRSYTGSRQQLLVAARRLLEASPLVGDPSRNGASSEVSLVRKSGKWPECLVASLSFRNSLSIERVLEIATQVERQLADPQKPGARETVRIDLVWVEGVAFKSPSLELPSPELFENGVFGSFMEESLQKWGLEAFPEQGPRERMIKALHAAPFPQADGWHRPFSFEQCLQLARKPEQQLWMGFESGRAEALAVAGFAAGVALAERLDAQEHAFAPVDPVVAKEVEHGLNSAAAVVWSPKAQEEVDFTIKRGRTLIEAADRSGPAVVFPVSVQFAGGATDDQRVLRWVSEVQLVARQHHLYVGQVVVLADEPTVVRGLVLGNPVGGPWPGVQLIDAGLTYVPDPCPACAESGARLWHLRLVTGDLFGLLD